MTNLGKNEHYRINIHKVNRQQRETQGEARRKWSLTLAKKGSME